MDEISRVLEQVVEDGNQLTANDPAASEKLVKSAIELVLAAETPVEFLLLHISALVCLLH